jgi:threonyl-tRNA synthetase
VRIIPVSEKFEDKAEELMKQIENNNIRVDVDDRPLSLGKKVRAAEKEWVNYVIVFGERETNSGILPVRDRSTGKQIRNLKLQELTTEIATKIADKPFKPLTLPKLLSKRPQFAF